MAKIIAVVGATGAQGGGLARAILADPQGGFKARAITRKVDSDKARALAEAGAEVVAADLDDVESLKRAFAGADGAFCVTNYWEHMSPERELQQAANLARATKAAGVQHVVWSTLEDSRKFVPLSDNSMPTLMDHYKVPHFDAKGESDAVFEQEGAPTTFLLTSFYWDNLIYFNMGPQWQNGVLTLALPMGDQPLPGIASEDIGRAAYGIFKKGTSTIGQRIGIVGESLTGKEFAEKLSAAMGQPVQYYAMEPETFRQLGFPGADDLGNMFQFNRDFSRDFVAARDEKLTRELNPKTHSFDQWLAENAKKIPVPKKP